MGDRREVRKKKAVAPKTNSAHAARAVLQEARDYLKQEKSPDSRMDGDTFEVYIQTLKELMRYDRTEFIVTPGLKVRLHFSNPDAMDHNLLMLQPGAAGKVAVAALKMETTGEGTEKQWIPESDAILFASNLLAHDEVQVIEFTAPLEPGKYEYICTFPGHWQLMRGVMTVTDKLKVNQLASNQPPAEDPSATSRNVVEYWELDALKADLAQVDSGRSYETGKKMFTVASCIQCHTIREQGMAIGPDLTELGTEYSAMDMLSHILDPSLQVADEYKTYVIESKGKEYYGMLVSQEEDTLSILENPLAPETAVTLKKSDIDVIEYIDISPMPTDLLITLSKSEIWDLLAFVLSGDDPSMKSFN